MNLNRHWTWSVRRTAGAALGGLLAVATAGAAHALPFTYNTGDLVAVFTTSTNELEIDLGPLATLANGTYTFSANGISGPVLGATGGVGGQFNAFSTHAPFAGGTGIGQNVTFTTDPSVNPHAFDNNVGAYVLKIGTAQTALDTGTAGGWMPGLNNFGAPDGTIVFLNTSNELSVVQSNGSSYTSKIGLGTNKVNGQLPFSTAANLATSSQVVDLWTGTRTGSVLSNTVLLGTLSVLGNPAGNGNTVALTVNLVPEPGTVLLVSSGLLGLLLAGRRRRKA